MRFAQPTVLWLLALLAPALAIFFIWAWRKKQRLVAQFVQSRLLANLTVGVSHPRQQLRLVLLFFTVVFAMFALARPQWGFDWQEATTQGLDVIVAIDTSKSMLAADITPNRLTRAKLASFDLMKQAKTDRLGVIAFAGSAFLQCPLTLDDEAFRQSVDALDVNIIPQGGSAVGEAIETARQAFEKSGDNHKVLVLFTDGEDHDSGAVDAAEKAAKDGVKIFTIGVGTPEGELLQVLDDQGNRVLLKDDQGNAIKSRLNETLLQQIATKASGFYLPLVGANPIEALYSKGLAPLPKSEGTTKLIKNYREQFFWPLGLAILLLIVEMFLPQHKRVRRTGVGAKGNSVLKATVVALLLMTPFVGLSSTSSAQRKYDSGKFDEALADYRSLLQKKTNDFRLYYNAGDAAYRAEQFDEAKKHFESSINSPDLELQESSYYNLGNTLYQIGETADDPKAKQPAWEQAIKSYESALKLNAKDEDAKQNLAFVKKKLEELKKQQQQQQNQDQKKPDPSEEAKKAKAAADEAVRQKAYRKAFDIMEAQLQKDPTTEHYSDYIQRLKEINGIKDSSVN